jgi:anti-sigma B factor antagonist
VGDCEFQRNVSQVNGATVVALRGELDVASSQELSDELAELIENGTTDLVIDLAQLAFIDSTGLSAILRANRSLERGHLVLREPNPLVRQVLEITGLIGALRIEP